MMTTQAKLYCYECKTTHYVYGLNVCADEPDRCPYCGAGMDDKMWQAVLLAINAVDDANRHFHKYHMEHGEPRFAIAVEYVDTQPR